VERRFSKGVLLTNAMLYWVTVSRPVEERVISLRGDEA
jgi:hypothetical protein